MSDYDQKLLKFQNECKKLAKLQSTYHENNERIRTMITEFNTYYDAQDKFPDVIKALWNTKEGKEAEKIGSIETPDGISRVYTTMEMQFTEEYRMMTDLNNIMSDANRKYEVASKGRILASPISENDISDLKQYNKDIDRKIGDLKFSVGLLEIQLKDDYARSNNNLKFMSVLFIISILYIFIK